MACRWSSSNDNFIKLVTTAHGWLFMSSEKEEEKLKRRKMSFSLKRMELYRPRAKEVGGRCLDGRDGGVAGA